MIEHVGHYAVWPTDNLLGFSVKKFQGWMNVQKYYSCAFRDWMSVYNEVSWLMSF